MSDDRRDRPRGPTMLVATEALRPPKLRIGRIGQNFTLPRTIPAAALVSGGLMALLFIAIFGGIAGYTISAVMYAGVVGGIIGVFIVSYSPMKGESLAKWLGLKVKTRGKRPRVVRGQPVRLAIGICYVDPPVSGPVQALPGAIPVRSGSFDDRGVRLEERRWTTGVAREGRWAGPLQVDEEVEQHRPRSPAEAMAAYRAASATSAFDGAAPKAVPYTGPTRRHGRWEQDADTLAGLYRNRPATDPRWIDSGADSGVDPTRPPAISDDERRRPDSD